MDLNILLSNPYVLISKLVFEAFPAAAMAYGVVWLVMRPKNGEKLYPPAWTWHLSGIALALFCSAILRIMAMLTFAGSSAFSPTAQTGEAGVYLLLIPAAISFFYIKWLKQNRLTVG